MFKKRLTQKINHIKSPEIKKIINVKNHDLNSQVEFKCEYKPVENSSKSELETIITSICVEKFDCFKYDVYTNEIDALLLKFSCGVQSVLHSNIDDNNFHDEFKGALVSYDDNISKYYKYPILIVEYPDKTILYRTPCSLQTGENFYMKTLENHEINKINEIHKNKSIEIIEAYFGHKKEFWLTDISLYSSTPASRHLEIWDHIIAFSPVKDHIRIVDMTACIGADTIHFIHHGEISRILAFEIEKNNFIALKHNINLSKYNHRILACNRDSTQHDSLNIINNFAPQWIYIDPPWINECGELKSILSLGNFEVEDLINFLYCNITGLNMILMKTPLNYKIIMNEYDIKTVESKKFSIVLFRKNYVKNATDKFEEKIDNISIK